MSEAGRQAGQAGRPDAEASGARAPLPPPFPPSPPAVIPTPCTLLPDPGPLLHPLPPSPRRSGPGWVGCNSSRPELHAYPCSLWLLFHTLVAHAPEPDALPTLHAIVGYVTNFFGCKECVGHFAVLAARLESDLRALAAHKHRGGRERAALWLWKAHNSVSERLAAEALTDSPATEFAEFAHEQWPPRTLCQGCRELSGPPKAGVRPSLQWREDAIYRQLLEQ